MKSLGGLCARPHGSISCKTFQRLRKEVMGGKESKEKDSEATVARVRAENAGHGAAELEELPFLPRGGSSQGY